MMKVLLLSALVMGPCLGQQDRRAQEEDLAGSPDEQAPVDGPPTPAPTPAGPQANVRMSVSGQASDYTRSYFEGTFFTAMRTATNMSPSIQLVLKSFYDGSVVVDIGLYGADASALASVRDNIVAQANDPTSALRTALPAVQNAQSADSVPYFASHHDDDLSDGAIAGIVIGCLVGVAGIVVLVYFLACKEDEPHGAGPSVDAPYGGGNDGGDLQKPENEEEMAQKPGTQDDEV